jgi:deazaflavin-dependent oxidoreductase (nitroreductase family)
MTSTPYYQAPSRLRRRLINPVILWALHRGALGGRDAFLMRILRVRGRVSGRTFEIPVRVVTLNENRYLVSMLGEAQWVRNLRAAGAAELALGENVSPVEAVELHDEQKRTVIREYAEHPQLTVNARYALKIDTKHLTPAEVGRAADKYPVFKLQSPVASEPGQ